MAKKKQYRIRIWKYYNKALVNRGNLTLWFGENVAENCYSKTISGQRGRPKVYSELAIEYINYLPNRGITKTKN